MRSLQLLLLLTACHETHGAALRVCTTPENAFDMIVDTTMKLEEVTSDAQLQGFDVDMRHQVLTVALNLSYSMRMLPSYGQLQVAVRKDECDIGWAPYFVKGNRERCVENNLDCRSLMTLATELRSFTTGTIDWCVNRILTRAARARVLVSIVATVC